VSGTEHFDQAAATWDLTERRVQLAHAVVEAMASRVLLSKDLTVLDYGCGTGLVTLELGPQVGSITGADTSPGMLKALVGKADTLGIPVRLLALDAAGTGDLGGPYDLIVSSMTLHHIADVSALFVRFMRHLNPSGWVALADLDEEDGSFHGEMVGVHHQGFPRKRIKDWLEDAGFQRVQIETATMNHKEGKDYSVFLATAQKT
jgi:tRNA (cmo5U34)-methyltransferase